MPRTSSPFLSRFLASPPGTSPGMNRVQIILKLGLPNGALVHSTWVPVFFYLDLQVLAYWNIVASLLFIWGAFMIHRPGWEARIVVLLAMIEMPAHGILATLYLGLEPAFWLFPVTSGVFILSMVSFGWRLRIFASAVIMVLSITALSFILITGPLVELTTPSTVFFFASNAVAALGQLVVLFAAFQRAVETAEDNLVSEFERAEGLLRNILPDPIALRLKDGEKLIADEHAEVSVIFADIVNFTEASAKLSPAQLLETLNIVFTEFDRLAQKHGAEKIKTIGDAYMAVIGAPNARQSHATVAVKIALEMLKVARDVTARTHFPIDLRIGINSGPVVAGVIGRSKFAYDLWGDAVNVASRMEAHAEPGKVLVTEATRSLLPADVAVTAEGQRDVKGKGPMAVFSIAAGTDGLA